MILIQCEGCQATVQAVWGRMAKTWHTPVSWAPFVLWDEVSGIARHACSEACHLKMRRRVGERPAVRARRESIKLVKD